MTRVFVLAMLIGAATIAGACGDSRGSGDTGTRTPGDSAEQVMFGARTVLTSAGVRRGELTADTAITFDAATRFELHSVRATFATGLLRPLGTLTTAAATYRVAPATLDARGPVVIASDTMRRRLEGAWVRYDSERNQLSSDSAFVATGSGRRLSGVGFVSDPGLFNVRCTSRCTGSLGP